MSQFNLIDLFVYVDLDTPFSCTNNRIIQYIPKNAYAKPLYHFPSRGKTNFSYLNGFQPLPTLILSPRRFLYTFLHLRRYWNHNTHLPRLLRRLLRRLRRLLRRFRRLFRCRLRRLLRLLLSCLRRRLCRLALRFLKKRFLYLLLLYLPRLLRYISRLHLLPL